MVSPQNQKAEVFTSWKEIANYLGKGVRTAQRWEVGLGLPVQRPRMKDKHIVRATKADLDLWMSTTWGPRKRTTLFQK